MKKAVIFDMDGTVLYTLGDIVSCMNKALLKNGLPEIEEEVIRVHIGNGIYNEVRHSVPEGTDEETIARVHQDFKAFYAACSFAETKPYDGIIDLLHWLKEQDILIAIVSNKGDFALRELNRIYFASLWDAESGERDGIARKPAPDMVLAVLDELGVEVGDAVYVGDSEVDHATAMNCGMDCILVSYGYRTREFLASLGGFPIVESVDELKKALGQR